MAKCNYCMKDMLEVNDCSWNRFVEFPDGKKLESVPYVCRKGNYKCRDCGVLPGKYHHPGCDMEICPKCKGQLISCRCFN